MVGKLSAGSYDLNKWLYGGYEQDVVTVFYGGPGTGKTTLCLLAAVSQARKGNKVVFVDTEGGFSVERVKQVLRAWKDEQDPLEVMKHIFLLKPTSFEEQEDAFRQLGRYLKKGVSLVVVDGMAILYRLAFAAAREKGNEREKRVTALLAGQMRQLAEIARKQEIPVLVTNQVYKWEEAMKMVGGDVLPYWGKCLIELTHDRGRRVLGLRKHRSLPVKEMSFQIYEGGVRKRGFL